MANKKEYKVVLFNKEARYISVLPCNTIGTAFSQKPHAKLMSLAMDVVKELASVYPNALVDSLMRVDVFQTKTGTLVVNEFESLEADHHSPHSDLEKLDVDDNIRQYYESILRSIIDAKHLIP